jgi:hypothetical protein
MPMLSGHRALARSIPVLLLVCLSGCGLATSTVSGTVRYRGTPLPDGTVMLLANDGTAHHGAIQPDGSFAIPKVPTGPARVSVTSNEPVLVGKDPERGREPRIDETTIRRSCSRIPLCYGDLQTSGLGVEVICGRTSLDLELTDR